MKIKNIPIDIINYGISYKVNKKYIVIKGFLSIRDKKERIKRDELYAFTNNKKYNIKFPFKRVFNLRGLAILSNYFVIKIPVEDMMVAPINNCIQIMYDKDNEIAFARNIRYSSFLRKYKKYANKKPLVLKEQNKTIVLRRTDDNSLLITSKEYNKTDEPKEQFKIALANICSKMFFRDICIMYEKEAEKYEESASVLYEALIDRGYKNVYYIIDRDSNHCSKIQEKYKKNIVYKYTFKHYLYYLSAKTFMATEAPRTWYCT